MRYRNSFYKPNGVDGIGRPHTYGPEFYETDAVPVEHAGHLIYERRDASTFGDSVFDVVKDGTCVAQRAGLTGAKQAAEALHKENPNEHASAN